MFDKVALTTLGAVSKLAEMAPAIQAKSLVEFTKTTRVEPVVLLEQNLAHQPYITDVLQSVNSIFAAYYLQAVAQFTKIGGVSVTKILDPLNPNRDVARNATGLISLATESFHYCLPTAKMQTGLEAYKDPISVSMENKDKILDNLANRYGDTKDVTSGTNAERNSKAIGESVNLSVGKLLSVDITSGKETVSIPVAVRLIVSMIDSSALTHTLSLGSKDMSMRERFHAWRAGALSTINDMIFCKDLVDAHRKNLIKDKTGFYKDNAARSNRNVISSLLSGSPSISTISNIIVMSATSAKALELEIGGRLKDFRIREKLFNDTYVMLLVVVDTQWEQVTIYHHSIAHPTELSVRDMKGASKDTNIDIAKILQSYHAGMAPSAI